MDIWKLLIENQDKIFFTVQGLKFTYRIKGYEMFVSRKEKSITFSTVRKAYERAMELQREKIIITGPKKLGDFVGSSYLYPIFIELGIIKGL